MKYIIDLKFYKEIVFFRYYSSIRFDTFQDILLD